MSKRFQNISPVITSVMKKSATGEFKSVTVRPGQIIHLTDDDVQYTRDAYNPSENSPIEKGWIQLVPENSAKHPDLPFFGKNPTIKSASEAFAKGREETAKMISKIKDQRGLVIVRRALEQEKESIGKVTTRHIEELIEKQHTVVDNLRDENEHKYALKD